MNTTPRVTTAIRLKPELHAGLQALGEDTERSMNWLINQAVEQYLITRSAD